MPAYSSTLSIKDLEQLESLLSEPSEAALDCMRQLEGDLMLIGAGGKMGPSLARMAKRADTMNGKRRKIYAVSRLRQEAKKAGLNYKVIRYEGIHLNLRRGKAEFFYKGRSLPEAKMAVFRVAGRGGAGEYFVPQRTALLELWQNRDRKSVV